MLAFLVSKQVSGTPAFCSMGGGVIKKAKLLGAVSTLFALTAVAGTTNTNGDATAGQNAGDQTAPALEEIIVTARKREESIMQTPVVLQVVTAQQIENLHIDTTYALAEISPGLQIAYGYATQGAAVNLRGLGNGSAANFIDPSVGLNIDGAGFTNGAFYRVGLFDIAQVEVLKGPQSLFFGKSTSAGLIAVHTADPTDTWDAKISDSYEFDADENDVTAFVSGPITDKIGIRIAGYHDLSEGYLTNPNPANPNHRIPAGTDNGGRITLKFDDPDIGLKINLKGTVASEDINAIDTDFIQGKCPTGTNPTPIWSQYDDCRINTVTAGTPPALPYTPNANFNAFNTAAFAAGTPSPLFKNGVPYAETRSAAAVLDIDYEFTRGLTLTSVSAYNFVKAQDSGTEPVAAVNVIYLADKTVVQENSEELRLASDWKDSWFNFMIGGLYNPSSRTDNLVLPIPDAGFIPGIGQFGLYTNDFTSFNSKVSSGFAQVLLTPIAKWELSAGLRYTSVEKYFTSLVALNNYPAFFDPGPSGETLQNVPYDLSHYREHNTSPEVTLTYRPTADSTAFISYKQGYKGPGYNASLTATSFNDTNISPFGGEVVKGVEGGIKQTLLDQQLRITASGYRYNYTGLQVSFVNVENNQITINNGANARVQGIELGADYAPNSIRGLTLNAFVNYNDAYYTSFAHAPCYGNEPVSAGCVVSAGGESSQNLGGRPLSYAAKWVGELGMSYKTAINEKYSVRFDMRGGFSSAYYFTPEIHPYGIQPGWVTLDSGIHLTKSDDSWDLGLLCVNCTNRIYVTEGSDGGAVNPGQVSVPDAVAVNRPWQVILQFTIHPFRFF